jgi:transposase
MYLKIKDRLGYIPMLGTLLGQELRKRKTPQEKIATIQQTM